jgi:hypothetical protein
MATVLASPGQGQTPPPSRIAAGPNLRVGPGEFNEVWLAVSATNPAFMIAVAQTGGGVDLGTQRDAATFASRDGGRQWTRVTLPDYRTAAELRTPVQPDHSRMVSDLSNGPNNVRLYIAWNDVADEFLRDHYEIFLQWSDDGGRTFNEPVLMDQRTGGKLVATEPVVLSDGTLLVTWYQYWNPLADPRNDRLPFFVRRSEDGATFAAVEQIFDFGPHVWRDRMGEFSRAFSLPYRSGRHLEPESQPRQHLHCLGRRAERPLGHLADSYDGRRPDMVQSCEGQRQHAGHPARRRRLSNDAHDRHRARWYSRCFLVRPP